MTKIEQIKAEIERRIAILNKELKPAASEDFVSSWASTANNKRVTLQSILSFIDSLEKEQPKGLDEAAEEAVLSVFTDYVDLKTPFREEKISIVKKIFYAGVKWIEEQYISCDGEVIAVGGSNGTQKEIEIALPISKPRFKCEDKVIVQIKKKED